MRILVTNDDGILADGLWVLTGELQKAGEVVVVAPDREQSAIGTAVTLTQPLRVHKVKPVISGIEAYAVQGTPGDSVILGIEKLFTGQIDVVVSGINEGLNVGTDVLISGTVGAALQGYLRGLPAMAISVSGTSKNLLEAASQVARLLAERIRDSQLHSPVFLNVNLPDRSAAELHGVRVTELASETHIDTVKEGHDGKRAYYWLVRGRKPERTHGPNTDINAVENGFVSLTPLHLLHKDAAEPGVDGLCSDALCDDLARQLAI